jgi:hypothetical protein
MRIAVIDGKGGGLGRTIVETIKPLLAPGDELLVMGTNSHATANMLRGGASDGATGENAVATMAERMDLIVGPIAIIAADAMMGEVTPRMAESISKCRAEKLLLPLGRCGIKVVGAADESMARRLERLADWVKEWLAEHRG